MHIKITNNVAEKYFLDRIYQDHPHTSFPSELTKAVLVEFGIYEVLAVAPPITDPRLNKLQESFQLVEDKWTQVWDLVPITTEELATALNIEAAAIRRKREELLVSSDWTQAADAPVSKGAWATYRKDLRDITKQVDFPWTVIWPVEPGATIPEVSPRQIRMALELVGLRTLVESAITSGNLAIKDWWAFSTAFERNNPQVIAMGEALEVSSDDLDNLWALAITL